MSLKAFLSSRISARLTSRNRLERARGKAERARQRKGRAHMIEYFHDASDPYSHLAAQVLPALAARYDVEIAPRLVPPPPDWAAPDREKLVAYSRRDATLLARKAGLSFYDPGRQPAPESLVAAGAGLAAAIAEGRFVRDAAAIGQWLWTGEGPRPSGVGDAETLKTDGAARRETLGHYLGATFHYEGEWYWGIDRLHHLERRLQALGAAKTPGDEALIFPPPELLHDAPATPPAGAKELHFYLSFRSPYTAIAAERVKALAAAYGAPLKLRYVLPMVMRGMQVPRMKGRYILKDTAREAHRLGIPFGKVVDPVGEAVERGYAVLAWAMGEEKGLDFALSFLRGVWAEGIDAGSDKGLKKITERAGLDWASAKKLIGGDHWQGEAEANRAEMMSLGLWGVPSFRVGDVAVWGQDRLWAVEDALKEDAAHAP
ncbi:DsbA family protein [Henriciella aquimarina]|uniref:DsbA family protein n=1 Tax=Henriciella aquimarina TaxID=545261 RepID=UPI000A01CE10|nr:DsbA family protein [Henriciella aquimarina]